MTELRRLARARESWLSTAGGSAPGARTEIVRSWQRSHRAGAAEDATCLPVGTPHQQEIDPAFGLVAAAAPVIAALVADLDGMRGAVQLADSQARLLDCHPLQSSMAGLFESVGASPGHFATEAGIGTNGVGTAVLEGRAVQIVGPEHFAGLMSVFACAAAPIRDEATGHVVGALNLAVPAEAGSPLLTATARRAARDIAAALRGRAPAAHQALLDALSTAAGRGPNPLCAVTDDLVLARPGVATLLRGLSDESLRETARRHGNSTDVVRLTRPDGVELQVVPRPVRVDGRVVGYLLEITGAADGAPRTAPPAPGPVLVTGERGAGKQAAVHALHPAEVASGRLRTLDTRSLRTMDERTWLGLLRAALARPDGITLILHLDDTPESLVPAVRGAVRQARETGRRFYGTATTGPEPEGRSRVLAGEAFSTVVSVPPVRERDVGALVAELTAQPALATDRQWTAAARAAVRAYDWPGNLRQLVSVLRAVAAGHGPVEVDELPPEVALASRGGRPRLERAERDTIVATLREATGNKTVAAARLGISRSSLYRKMAQYRIAG